MADIVLSARHLTKRFGGLIAVSDVSIDVHRDEIHAVIGPNGAGKSTLVNLLSGEIAPGEGSVHLAGKDMTARSPDQRARAGLGRSYQKTTIFPDVSVFANARLAAQARSPKALRFFGDAGRDPVINAQAAAALSEAGIAAHADTPARHLSHGGQRQLEIAMVLATTPSILLLDEPLAGMGPAEAQDMIALVSRLRNGRGILLVEHDMDAVFALADRLTVMADGHVIATGTPAQVRADPAVRVAYLGEDCL